MLPANTEETRETSPKFSEKGTQKRLERLAPSFRKKEMLPAAAGGDDHIIDYQNGHEILGSSYEILLQNFNDDFVDEQMAKVEQELQLKNWKGVQDQVHILKGASASISAPGVSSASNLLQREAETHGSHEDQESKMSAAWQLL